MTELRYRDGRVCRTDRTADELVTDMHAAAASVMGRLNKAKDEIRDLRRARRVGWLIWAAFFLWLGFQAGVSS